MSNPEHSSPLANRLYRDQIVTVGDLEAFKEELLLALIRLIKEHVQAPDKKWIKSYQVKQLLNISHQTLQTVRNNGMLPFTKIGNIIYYDLEEVNRVLSGTSQDFRKTVIRGRQTINF